VRQLSRVLLSQESTYDPTMANRAALQAVDVGRHHGFYPVEVTFSLRTEHCAFETAIRPQLAHTFIRNLEHKSADRQTVGSAGRWFDLLPGQRKDTWFAKTT
jgi:hypothetical protein